ncbi:ORF3 [Torque teno mini virus 11]|uniref:ORF3 n=1 Tax=Torque teno mini virus 11 TaxID=2065037 RepID=A8DMR0_9VIRU|nr:ORF3 [Torque teno mini virus 11]ABU55894.1 ORF3 [Torque teno mini virus 11]
MIPVHSQNGPQPVTSNKQFRSRIQNTTQATTSTLGTLEGTFLQTQLSKDLKKTKKLMRLFQLKQAQKAAKRRSPSPPNTPRKLRRSIDTGKKERDTAAQAPQTPTKPPATTAAAHQIPKITIIHKPVKINLFNDPVPVKNRPFKPWEWEDEKFIASWLKRPQRHYFYDKPTYPIFPITPLANFDLNFKE